MQTPDSSMALPLQQLPTSAAQSRSRPPIHELIDARACWALICMLRRATRRVAYLPIVAAAGSGRRVHALRA